MKTLKTTVTVLASLAMSGLALACLHLPSDYPGGIGQTYQEAIVFWNEGRELLVLRNDYVLELEDEALPAKLAWVVPVPALPDDYGVADRDAFADLSGHSHVEDDWERDATGAKQPSDDVGVLTFSEDGGVDTYDLATVGPYAIQPVKAETSAALNDWLVEHGFPSVAPEATAYYVERGWVFLCVQVDPAAGSQGLAEEGRLSPLRIAFATERPVYPLKFSTHQGDFDVGLWLITDRPFPELDPEAQEFEPDEAGGELTFEEDEGEEDDSDMFGPQAALADAGVASRWMPIPASVDAIQLAAAKAGVFKALDNRVGVKVPHVTSVTLSVSGEDVAEWKEDLFFPLPDASGILPATQPGREIARGPEPEICLAATEALVHSYMDEERYEPALRRVDGLLAASASSGLHLLRSEIYRARAMTLGGAPADSLAAAADLERAIELGIEEPDEIAESEGGAFGFDGSWPWTAERAGFARATCLAEAGRHAEALAALEALGGEPRHGSIGYSQLGLGLAAEAAATFEAWEAGVGAEPSAWPAAIDFAQALAAALAGKQEEALDHLRDAWESGGRELEASPAWWRLMLTGEIPTDSWEPKVEPVLFELALGRGDLAAVERLAELAAEEGVDPSAARWLLASAHCALGLQADRAGDDVKARLHYQAVVQTGTHQVEGLWAAGRLAQIDD